MEDRWGGAPSSRAARPDDLRAEVEAGHLLLRRVDGALDRAAAAETDGWPVPFTAARYLILVRLHRSRWYGVRPSRLARELELARSTVSHHLGVLDRIGMVDRTVPGYHDGRIGPVRITERGLYAVLRMDSELRRARASSIL